MSTNTPSWLETWLASFPDVGAIYRATIPAQYPANLYDDVESSEYAELQAEADVLSWVAQASQWLRSRIFPQNDAEALFLGFWEDILGLTEAATVALRQAKIIRTLRYTLGTATEDVVKAIFAPIFGDADNPDAVALLTPTEAQITANPPQTAQGWARATYSMHIYHAAETAEPDRPTGLDAIEQEKPATDLWTLGRYAYAKWDTQGGWDTACWSA